MGKKGQRNGANALKSENSMISIIHFVSIYDVYQLLLILGS